MDVTLYNGNTYAPPPMPLPPTIGTVESPTSAYAPPPPPVERERPERSERSEPDMLARAVSEINTSLTAHMRHMSIRHHEATNRRIVRVYDSITDEVIREIPPEEVLNAHANILELAGIFVNTRG